MTKTFLLVGALVASWGTAQADDGSAHAQLNMFARMGGAMHVLAEQCKVETPARLAQLKAEQLSAHVARGGSAAEFTQLFNQGYQEAAAKWSSTRADQRQKACAQANAMRQAYGANQS